LAYTEGRFDDGMALAKQRLESASDDVDLYWHVARFYYEIGERYDRTATVVDKEALYQSMADVANAGLVLSPGHPHLLFAKGIALGRLGTTQGVLSSLFLAEEIEQSWLQVAESDFAYRSLGGEEILPCDAYMSLGVYYRMVPDWWIVEWIAGTRGDLDKSLLYLDKANACSPNRIEVLKELGVGMVCIGQHRDQSDLVESGLQHLRSAISLPPKKPTDATDLKHLQMLLNQPELACEYSRDGQAELDRSKLMTP